MVRKSNAVTRITDLVGIKFGEPITAEGTVQSVGQDHSVLQLADGQLLRIQFNSPPPGLEVGKRVRVTGMWILDEPQGYLEYDPENPSARFQVL